jgi:hypothetical protein
MLDEQAAYFVGQALGHLHVGSNGDPQVVQRGHRSRRPLDPQQAAERAGRSVNRAFQLYLRAGLTKEQAVQRIVSLAQTLGSST